MGAATLQERLRPPVGDAEREHPELPQHRDVDVGGHHHWGRPGRLHRQRGESVGPGGAALSPGAGPGRAEGSPRRGPRVQPPI